MSKKNATKRKGGAAVRSGFCAGAPKWKITKSQVTITMSKEWALSLAQTLNEWKSWTPWVDRADCKHWKRSPIARENKRESQTFSNCLSSISATLGRRELNKLMDEAKAQNDKLGHMERIQSDALEHATQLLTANADSPERGFNAVYRLMLKLQNAKSPNDLKDKLK